MVRLKRFWWVPLVVALAAFLLYGAWYSWGPRITPAGQPPLAVLDAGSSGSFVTQFNAAAGETRLLLLLSPT